MPYKLPPKKNNYYCGFLFAWTFCFVKTSFKLSLTPNQSVQCVRVRACVFVRVCLCMCACRHACMHVCVCILHIVMPELSLMSTLCVSFCQTADNIFHLDVHYLCYIMFDQRFELRGRHFTNLHYYHYYYPVFHHDITY